MPNASETARKPAMSATNRRSVLFGFGMQVRRPNGKWALVWQWKRIVVAFVLFCILGYALLMNASYVWFRYRKGYGGESYWKIYALPFRMQEHRCEMGDYQVEQSLELFKMQKYIEGFKMLRMGVTRSPKNLKGRQLLADFYIRIFQQPESGLEILRGGIPYAGDDQRYLNSYLALLNKYMKDAEVLELTEAELAKNPSNPLVLKTLVLHRAQALALLVRYDEMEELLEKYGLVETEEGALLIATIDWTRDHRDEAIETVRKALDRAPARNKKPLYAALTRYLRESGRLAEARRIAAKWMLDDSMDIQPRIEYLHLLHAEGDYDYERQYANATLNLFANEQSALLLLANYATSEGNLDLVRRIYECAVEREFDISAFTLLLIETYIAAGDYAGAIVFIEEISNEKPAWLTPHRALFDSLRAVAYYGNGNNDLCTLYLNQFLASRSVRVENLLAIADRLEKLGALDKARQILAHAYNDHPENQIVLTRLTHLDLQLGMSENLGQHLMSLMKMRRPSPKLLVESYRSLGSDRFIFVKDRERLIEEILKTIERSPKIKSIHDALEIGA